MALWGGSDYEVAKKKHAGRESASDKAARKATAKDVADARGRRARHRRTVHTGGAGGGESFADRSARSTTGWFWGRG